jgi:DNA-binding NarL/FixJ family response regulator
MRGRGPARILLIEDEMLVSMTLEDALLAAGHEVVGPVSRLDAAIDAAAEADIDIALVDLRLHEELSTPAVNALRARGIPFALVTGYDGGALPADLQGELVLGKPFDEAQILAAVSKLLLARRGN